MSWHPITGLITGLFHAVVDIIDQLAVCPNR